MRKQEPDWEAFDAASERALARFWGEKMEVERGRAALAFKKAALALKRKTKRRRQRTCPLRMRRSFLSAVGNSAYKASEST